MSDPIEDYIRANRDQYPREVLTGQMEKAGHDRAAIEAAWERLPPAPEKTATGHPETAWNAAPGIIPDEHRFPKDILVRTYRAKNQVQAAARRHSDRYLSAPSACNGAGAVSGGLGALSMAWISVEASMPLGWRLMALVRQPDSDDLLQPPQDRSMARLPMDAAATPTRPCGGWRIGFASGGAARAVRPGGGRGW